MKCPGCNNMDSRVLDSRSVDDGTSIRRRRECAVCGKRFTTYEVIDKVQMLVVKRDGTREFFDKHKIEAGITRACQKRNVNAAEIADSIETELQNSLVGEVGSKVIGEMVLSRLIDLDIVSYIRFASVYREFGDIDSFMKELKSVAKRSKLKDSEEDFND